MSYFILAIVLSIWTILGIYRLWHKFGNQKHGFWVEFLIDLPAMILVLFLGSIIHTIRIIMGRK